MKKLSIIIVKHFRKNMLEKIQIGIDLVDVKRFRDLPISTNKKFYERIFTHSEIEYCSKFVDPYVHFAGKFALKEALIKSINLNVDFLKIITKHFDSKPIIEIIDCQKKFLFQASISHEKDYAIGIILSEEIC